MSLFEKSLLIVFLAISLSQVQAASKYTNETRPYEFGFTIDGEQHRHEKKDENGIIMGEFGFITADGVYHVTVYATDENGNFKILSMKNIRVKPYPTSSSGTDARKGHSLPLPQPQIQTSAPQVQGPSTLKPVPEIPKKDNNFAPSRSCSHCSLPTTTKRPEYSQVHQHNISNNIYNNPPSTSLLGPKSPESNQIGTQAFIKEKNQPQSNGDKVNRNSPNNEANQQQKYASTGQNQYENPSAGLNQYETPSAAQNQYQNPRAGQNQYQNPSSGQNQYQNPSAGQNQYQTPSAGQNQYGNPSAGQSQYQNPIAGQKQYQTPSAGQNEYQNPNTGQNQYQNPNTGENQYQNPSSGQNQIQNPSGGQVDYQNPGSRQEHYQNSIGSGLNSNGNFANDKNKPNNFVDNAKNIDTRINTDITNDGVNYNQNILPNTKNSHGSPYSGDTIVEVRNPKELVINNQQQSDGIYNKPDLSSFAPADLNQPKKPVLISAQMQIVDKNTDITYKKPNEKDGLPEGITKGDMETLLYTFNYTLAFHGHYEEGYTSGAKQGYYFVTSRDGVRTRIDYVADENGFRPKITQEVLELISEDVPKPETEKDEKYGLKGYEFKWLYFPVASN